MVFALLEAKGLNKYFGGVAAVKNLDLTVNEGEILGLIGPNGAGKTTLFNLITGFYAPDSGTIKFKGENIEGLQPYKICRKGVGRTFQIPKPFHNVSVLDNVAISVMFGRHNIKNVGQAKEKAAEILQFMGLSDKEDFLPRFLTVADLKRLELAKGLATGPELLLLDEVVAGLNPAETIEAINLVRKIRSEFGITLFVIEHVMKAIMTISDRMLVIHYGEKIAEGTPKSIANNAKVIEAYLGEKYVF